MRALSALILTALLPACTQPDAGSYPALLPLDQLNAPPGVPSHAADAAADPAAVGAALKARAADAETRGKAIDGPVADATTLGRRADALRARAKALQTPCPAGITGSVANACTPR